MARLMVNDLACSDAAFIDSSVSGVAVSLSSRQEQQQPILQIYYYSMSMIMCRLNNECNGDVYCMVIESMFHVPHLICHFNFALQDWRASSVAHWAYISII
jgi:hypothetical protein